MADDSSRALEERHVHKMIEHTEGPDKADGHASHPAPAPAVLGDARLGGRGNAPVRAAAVQRMQQTLGNRATRQLVQRAARISSLPAPADDIGARIQGRSGGGSALDAGVQRQLESGLGADLSGVRVHTDAEADHLARSVDSVAFTTGSNIFFRSGMYNPGSSEGMHLLAHEATHTVQQAAGPVAGTPTSGGVAISDPGDSYEQAANAAAGRVSAGQAATPAQAMSTGAYAAVQRQGPEEEEPVQAMRTSAYTAVQREGEEEEPVQAMRTGAYTAVQREGEEEEPVQAMRTSSYTAVQRQGEEEEPVQAMRTGAYTAVQRQGEEEEPVQAMRADLAVQREGEEEEM